MEELKKDAIERAKLYAAGLLSRTDWKVIRYRDQAAAGIETSLSETEYVELLEHRQAIRDRSDEIEAKIRDAETAEDVRAIDLDEEYRDLRS